LGALLSGVHEKSATAITTTAEGIASLVGAITFVVLSLTGATVADWGLLPSLWIGAFPAAVVGPFAVRALPTLVWRYLIPVYSILIGSLLLIVLYGFGSR
jgi:undecaprenyl pyrophosphate phosphatase UppP